MLESFEVWTNQTIRNLFFSKLIAVFLIEYHPINIRVFPLAQQIDVHGVGVEGISGFWVTVYFKEG